MASNGVATLEEFVIGPNDGSPLCDGELWVNFAVEPEDPEEDIIPVQVRLQRSLLSSDESAKVAIPLLLSHTTLPEPFHHCPEFIGRLSEYVCSLPGDIHHVSVYGHVAWDDMDPTESVWFYRFSTGDFSSTDELGVM